MAVSTHVLAASPASSAMVSESDWTDRGVRDELKAGTPGRWKVALKDAESESLGSLVYLRASVCRRCPCTASLLRGGLVERQAMFCAPRDPLENCKF